MDPVDFVGSQLENLPPLEGLIYIYCAKVVVDYQVVILYIMYHWYSKLKITKIFG